MGGDEMKLRKSLPRDVVFAAAMGAAGELLVAATLFAVQGDGHSNHFLLEMTQQPGAEVAERLYPYFCLYLPLRYGLYLAYACTIILQATLFTPFCLLLISLVRLVAGRHTPPLATRQGEVEGPGKHGSGENDSA